MARPQAWQGAKRVRRRSTSPWMRRRSKSALWRTGSGVRNAPVLPDVLEQIPDAEAIASVMVDGAYGMHAFHDPIRAGRRRPPSHPGATLG